jgi:signal peptidase I
VVVYAGTFGALLSLRFLLGTEYPLAVVEGTSMNPTYLDGDLLILRGVAPETIAVDTVIVFHSPYEIDKFIVHRVKQIVGTNGQIGFITKGDNNWTVDPWTVPAQNIVGIVIYRLPAIAPVGRLLLAMQSPAGRIISGVLIVLIIAVDIYHENRTKEPKADSTAPKESG